MRAGRIVTVLCVQGVNQARQRSMPQPTLAPVHTYAIDALVEEMKWPREHVVQLYVHELTRLQSGASVKDYLALLASKRVREALRRAKSPGGVPSPASDLPT